MEAEWINVMCMGLIFCLIITILLNLIYKNIFIKMAINSCKYKNNMLYYVSNKIDTYINS